MVHLGKEEKPMQSWKCPVVHLCYQDLAKLLVPGHMCQESGLEGLKYQKAGINTLVGPTWQLGSMGS